MITSRQGKRDDAAEHAPARNRKRGGAQPRQPASAARLESVETVIQEIRNQLAATPNIDIEALADRLAKEHGLSSDERSVAFDLAIGVI